MLKLLPEAKADPKPFSCSATKGTNGIGGAIYGPSGWAKVADASSELIRSLQSQTP